MNLSDADAELLKQTKMSSTFIREWIVAKAESEQIEQEKSSRVNLSRDPLDM